MENLTNSQLLAQLISQKTNALSESIMEQCNNELTTLEHYIDILDIVGLSKSKKSLIKCIFELANRINDKRAMKSHNVVINRPEELFNIMNPYLSRIDHEEVWIVYMSRNGKLLSKERLGSGDNSSCCVDINTLLLHAIALHASNIALFHNHPHSSLNPSSIDKKLTSNVKEMAKVFNIKLIDHLIISDGRYYSFADEGEL